MKAGLNILRQGNGGQGNNSQALTRKCQRRGCLPAGFDHESWLSIAQFCCWRNRSRKWLASHKRQVPGLCGKQVHVGAHLRGVFPGLAKHF